MANLQDNIRLDTIANLDALTNLVSMFNRLGLNIKDVAAASRLLSDQMKRDADEEAKLRAKSIADINRQNAELKKQAEAIYPIKKASDDLFGSFSSLVGIRSQVIALFGAFSLGSFAKEMIDAQSKVESFQLGLKNLLGANYGGKLVDNLKQFTVDTPLNFEEVISYTNKLVGSFKATGASSREISESVIPILNSLGNTASALGGGDRLGRLIYAFTQVQATGRLMGTEVRQITETGFPLLAVMAEKSGKSVQQLQADIHDGKVSFTQFEDAILSAGAAGGVFSGSMDIMTQTISGRIDKLKETVFFALSNIGKQFNQSAKEAINFGIGIVNAMFGTADATKKTIEVISNLVQWFLAFKTVQVAVTQSMVLYGTVTRAYTSIVGFLTSEEQRRLIVQGNQLLLTQASTAATIEYTAAQEIAIATSKAFSAALGVIGIALVGAYTAYQIFSEKQKESIEITAQRSVLDNETINNLRNQQFQLIKVREELKYKNNEEVISSQVIARLNSIYPEFFQKLELEGKNYGYITQMIAGANSELSRNIQLMASQVRSKVFQDEAIKIANQLNELSKTDLFKGIDLFADNAIKNINKVSAEAAKVISFDEFGGRDRALLAQVNKAKELATGFADIQKKITGESLKQLDISNKSYEEQLDVHNKKVFKKSIDAENDLYELKLKYNQLTQAEIDTHNEKMLKLTLDAAKEGKEKALEYQKDSLKQQDLMDELVYVKTLEATRMTQQAELDIQKAYDIEKINNAKGSATKKALEIEKIDNEYRKKSADLTATWDKKDKDSQEQVLKEQAKNRKDNKLEQYLMDELVYTKMLEASRDNEQRILDIQKQYDESRVKNSILTEQERAKKLEDIESQYRIDSADLNRKWNAKDRIQQEKDNRDEERFARLAVKEIRKIEEERNDLIDSLRLLDRISKAKNSKEILLIEKEEAVISLKNKKARIDEQLDLEKKNLSVLRLLGLQETTEYKNKELAILKLAVEQAKTEADLAEATTKYKEAQLKKQVSDADAAFRVVGAAANAVSNLIAKSIERSINDSSSLMEKAIAENKKQGLQIANQALSIVTSLAKGDYVSAAIGAIEGISNAIDLLINGTDRVIEAQIKQATKDLEDFLKVAKQGVDNLIAKFDEIKTLYGSVKLDNGLFVKDIVAATSLSYQLDKITKTIATLKGVNGVTGFDITNILDGLNGIQIGLDGLSIAKETLEQAIKVSGFTIEQLINAEIDRGQKIQDNYEKAVDNEDKLHEKTVKDIDSEHDKNIKSIDDVYDNATKSNEDIYDKQIKSINNVYDGEVKRINDNYNLAVSNINAKYDLENTRANQKYDAETLAIMKAGSVQLEALIKNEDSLNSVRTEYAGKRQYILDTYALANKEITANTSAEEVTAINAAIKARDEALAKLQKWYNDELTFIVNSEGQKRKEYSETEKIQNDISDRLEKAAIKFNAAEITRALDKNVALKTEADKKDAAELVALSKKNAAELEAAAAKSAAQLQIDIKYNVDKAMEDFKYNTNKEAEEFRHSEVLKKLELDKNTAITESFATLTALLQLYSSQITDALENSAAKGTEAYAKLAEQLAIVNALLKQIGTGNLIPFLPIGVNLTGLNGFEKGTDNTSVSMVGKPTVDNKGGWAATIHPDEAIFSKADMTQMTRFMGSRPTRADVIERFAMGSKLIDSSSFIQKVSPYVINKTEGNVNIDLQGLRSDLSKLTREVVKRQQPLVQIDKNGIRTYMTNINSQIEIKNQKFSS